MSTFAPRCVSVGLQLAGMLLGSAAVATEEPAARPSDQQAASDKSSNDSRDGRDQALALATRPSDSPNAASDADNHIEQAQQVRPMQPAEPLPAAAPTPAAAQELAASLRGASDVDLAALSQERRTRATAPGTSLALGSDAKTRPATDAGSLLGKSAAVLGVGTQRRTPIVTDTLSRGQHVGQQAGAGSFWFPARQDLDTLLSKLDSRIISDIIVIKGPYSTLYGPGLSFYDVELLGTPRYANGFESHGSTSVNYQTNGQQWYGRQSAWGGSTDWGFRAGYGHRTGNDYETGDDRDMPSSYKSRDVDFALGGDLTRDSHIEFHYLRLDQTDVEFPGQFLDIDFLVTDAYELSYVLENQCLCDRLTFETWYNRTRFEGNAQRSGKRQQIPLLDAAAFVSFTDVDALSTGFRLALTWGDAECGQLISGADLRRLGQQLNEFTSSPLFGVPGAINFPIPRSHSTNPGLFLETHLPLNDRLTVRSGARVDWVVTDADRTVDGTDVVDLAGNPTNNLEEALGGGFDQHFDLWSIFLTAEYELDCHWTARGGFGHSMRPPTMTELYAVTPFLATLPQFVFNSPLGNPNLDSERLWQIDLGLKADYCRFRGGINGFYSWIQDYITFDALSDPPSRALAVTMVNTDLATLSGGEIYGEFDWNCWITPFATMSYVEGRDHSRRESDAPVRRAFAPGTPRSFVNGAEEPLPVIAPLESRVGVRFREPCERPRWGVELSARVVDNQDRVATSLGEQETPGFTTYDLRGFWSASENLLLVAGIENFTDKAYQEHFDPHQALGTEVFQPGLNFYFGCEVRY